MGRQSVGTHLKFMSIIIKKEDELPLIVKLLKLAIKEKKLKESETFVAHELYEDLKHLK